MAYKQGIMPLTLVHKPPYTVEATEYDAIDGHTIPRRHPKAKDGLLKSPADDIATVYDFVLHSAKKYPKEPATGSRKLVKMHTEMKKVSKLVDGEVTEVEKEWQFFELSKFDFCTYEEYGKLIHNVGRGLRKLGLGTGNKVHLFAATSRNWLAMSHGCSSQSMAIVTAYDSLGTAGVEHTLLQAEVDAMYIDPQLMATAAPAIEKAKTIQFVVYNDSSVFATPDHSEVDAFKKAHPNLKVLSFSELVELGEANPCDPVPPSPEDIYCLMYTSGSTGAPKGVPMTHANVVAAGRFLRAFRRYGWLTMGSHWSLYVRGGVRIQQGSCARVPPPRPHLRTRPREPPHLPRCHPGLWQPSNPFGCVDEALPRRHEGASPYSYGWRAPNLGDGPKGSCGQG
jgi:long-chain acyl-CoA synthetase